MVEGQRRRVERRRERVVEWLVVAEGQKEGWRRERVVDLASGRTREARSGDAASLVVQRTRMSGREVPERVRRPREELGARHDHADGRGREDSPATTKREVATPFSFFGVCVNVCGRRLPIKIESFKCCRVSGFIRIFLLCAFCVFLLCAFGAFELCALFVCH